MHTQNTPKLCFNLNTFFPQKAGCYGCLLIEDISLCGVCIFSLCFAGFSPETLVHGRKLATLNGLCVCETLCNLSMQVAWFSDNEASVSTGSRKKCFCDWFSLWTFICFALLHLWRFLDNQTNTEVAYVFVNASLWKKAFFQWIIIMYHT